MRYLLLSALVGCGAAASDFMTPVWTSTVEACLQRQITAVREAETREEAEQEVAKIRERCDEAYTGLRAAGWILDVTLPEDEE